MLPKDAPKIIDKNSNCCKAFSPNPYNGINPKTKKNNRINKVHFNFSLKERRCFGPFTSGRFEIIVSRKDIVAYSLFCCAGLEPATVITSPPAAATFSALSALQDFTISFNLTVTFHVP